MVAIRDSLKVAVCLPLQTNAQISQVIWQRIPHFAAQCVVDGVFLARFTKVGHVWYIPTISLTECILELLLVHVQGVAHIFTCEGNKP